MTHHLDQSEYEAQITAGASHPPLRSKSQSQLSVAIEAVVCRPLDNNVNPLRPLSDELVACNEALVDVVAEADGLWHIWVWSWEGGREKEWEGEFSQCEVKYLTLEEKGRGKSFCCCSLPTLKGKCGLGYVHCSTRLTTMMKASNVFASPPLQFKYETHVGHDVRTCKGTNPAWKITISNDITIGTFSAYRKSEPAVLLPPWTWETKQKIVCQDSHNKTLFFTR